MKLVKLKKIAKITSGSTAPKDKEFSIEGYPFIRVSHLDDLISESYPLDMPKITIEIANKRKMKLSEKESIVFAKSGMSCLKNRVLKLKEDSYIVNHLACVKVFSELVNVDYLRYYFGWFKPSKLVIDESYPSIRLSDIGELNIPVPPLETQKKIVEALDKAQGLIDARKEQIRLMDELIQSVFYEMFGDQSENPYNYPIIQFEDVIEYMGDIGSNGANSVVSANLDMRDQEDYALMVRFLNFTQNDFKENVKYISEEAYNFFKKSKVYGGELIFCKIGSAGLNYIMPTLNRPVSLGLNQIMVRTNDKINMIYLYNLLNTKYGKHLIEGCVNGAVTKSITKGAMKKLPIMYPPWDKQNEYAVFVEQMVKSKSEINYSLNELQVLFDSMMQKLFK